MAKMQYIGNIRSNPAWLGDFSSREHILPVPARIDPAQFSDALGINVAVSASALQNATSITVTALTPSVNAATALIAGGNVLIPAGTVLYFGGAKVATLTADAVVGATSLTVAALPTALAGNETATYSPFGTLTVASGTLIGRTYAERDAGIAFGPAAITDDEIFLMWNDVADARQNPDVELVRHAAIIKENYLPGYTTFSAATNEVQTITIGGTTTAGSYRMGIVNTSGNLVWTTNIAWNASLATIQAALDTASGIANGVVVTGTAGGGASQSLVLTYSGTGYANKPQTPAAMDINDLTGATSTSIVRTTGGGAGSGMLAKLRSLYRCITGKE